MKILSQDKSTIMEMPREIWVTNNGNQGGIIVCTAYKCLWPGYYDSLKRAEEVLHEIFAAYKRGDRTYEMPKK